MKILVLQLARLGDIYMTWPLLRAMRRAYPEAQIHLMTRTKFDAATEGLTGIDQHLSLPSRSLLEPLIQPSLDLKQAMDRLGVFLKDLQEEQYDWIFNATFSPVSSFLTHAIAGPQTRVTGYTRHSDGFLAIPDDVSAYFYGQVGVGSDNRVHLADIFVSMAGLEYTQEDWAAPRLDSRDFGLPENYILIHIGASEAKKSLPPFKWARVLKNFFDHDLTTPIVMIGSSQERGLGEAIEAGVSRGRVINLIGQTHLRDVFGLLQGCRLLVGCDSAPMHMASLVNTPCLNISFNTVNFWETGPKASCSFIYRAFSPEDVVSEEVGRAIHQILQGESPNYLAQRAAGLTSYELPEENEGEFRWNLVKAIYLGESFPTTNSLEFCQAVEKLHEVNKLAQEHIRMIPDKGLEAMAPLLQRVDDVISAVARVVPDVQPFLKWYQTEKLRIAPASLETVAEQTLEVHRKLESLLSVYMLEDSIKAHDSVSKG